MTALEQLNGIVQKSESVFIAVFESNGSAMWQQTVNNIGQVGAGIDELKIEPFRIIEANINNIQDKNTKEQAVTLLQAYSNFVAEEKRAA